MLVAQWGVLSVRQRSWALRTSETVDSINIFVHRGNDKKAILEKCYLAIEPVI